MNNLPSELTIILLKHCLSKDKIDIFKISREYFYYRYFIDIKHVSYYLNYLSTYDNKKTINDIGKIKTYAHRMINFNNFDIEQQFKIIKKLTIYYSYRSSNELPKSLTHLKFGFTFNDVLPILPNTLTHLIFGYNFNQVLRNLPRSLRYLKLDHCYNHPIPLSLPSLIYLCFGFCYNYNFPLDNLPDTLQYLRVGYTFNQKIEKLPRSLVYLVLGDWFGRPYSIGMTHKISEHLPQNVKLKLCFQNDSGGIQNISNLPITHITFGDNFGGYFYKYKNIPSTVTHMIFGKTFNNRVTKLPKSLIYLEFGQYFNRSVTCLPKSIKTLKFGEAFNHELGKFDDLQYLVLGKKFTQDLNYLPKTLIKLKCHCQFYPINLPRLKYLNICNTVNYFLSPITYFVLRCNYQDLSCLPKTVIFLKIPYCRKIPKHVKYIHLITL